MTDMQFFPAVMVGHFNRITSQPDARQFRFWGEGSTFQYDKLLYSFYYLQDRYKKLKDGESYFESILTDSGGFQVKTLGVSIEPEDVISVYEREHPDVGMILDVPMNTGWNQEGVDKTYKSVKYMVEQKHRIPNTQLLNISHGFTLEDRKNYYEIFKEFNNDLDGWAIGLSKRLPPIFNAWSFLHILENDPTMKDKRFHFLGLTGNKNMPIIYYLGKMNLVKEISFDSTKYGREGIMADMRNPSFMGERLSISRNAKGKMTHNNFCPCPVCNHFTMEQMQHDVNCCILHNLFWECRKFDFFDAFETAEGLKNHIMEDKTFPDATKVALKFIDYALEHGLDDAEEVFASEFKVKNAPKKQETLI